MFSKIFSKPAIAKLAFLRTIVKHKDASAEKLKYLVHAFVNAKVNVLTYVRDSMKIHDCN